MDLTPYKKQLNSLKQCIVNVELAMTAYRTAEEACSYGMAGAHVRAEEAKERLEMAQDTLRRQARINFLLNQEVTA